MPLATRLVLLPDRVSGLEIDKGGEGVCPARPTNGKCVQRRYC